MNVIPKRRGESWRRVWTATVFLAALHCASGPGLDPQQAVSAVNAVVDDWHKAASEADESRYFDHMASDAVFLGTDSTERWEKAAFRDFAHPYFAKGKAWTFKPHDRHVYVSARGDAAWFDERLDSDSYGDCRGTGALRRENGSWRIAQYNLSIPIPNALAKEFVRRIREGAEP
jgi:ketosteroid isomerase-like protein